MYAVATENGTALHYVRGSIEDVSGFGQVVTLCGRTVKPLNYFLSLASYVGSYNCRGKACQQCAHKIED